MASVPFAPPLKIQGIKTRAVPHIRTCMDWDGRGRWLEPFAGTCAVALNIAPDRAVLGDVNPHLIRFHQAVLDGEVSAGSVRAFLEREGALLVEEGEAHYYRIRGRFNASHDPHDFLFLNRSCFNGLMRFNAGGGFNVPFCRKPGRFRPGFITRIVNQVERAAHVMRGRDREFRAASWEDILSEARPGDFVYADPPYEGRSAGYWSAWTQADAERLEAELKALPCRFMLSMWSENRHRRNARLHEAFRGYDIRTFRYFYHLGPTESLRGGMTEALVLG